MKRFAEYSSQSLENMKISGPWSRNETLWSSHVSKTSGLARTIQQDTVNGKKKTKIEEGLGSQYQRVDSNGRSQVS